ncbi:CocE/NonD family hydrolase [Kutzneria sp. CA-103260]|uniref:CocE/NonD family hydrolase n=1 Tax=Kutzneria sp. CA-103260 TaxID=2802641 RepID=UPI001BACECAD|nr:CocE/NonD family hydrolase [Kutzneria sp. CA-103260]QUQ63702.1 X-Pro dipeptidyl-peptidase [Kutzneria sp. CA-103260]
MRFEVDIDVQVPGHDGTPLATNIWRPVVEGTVPVLLVRTPYGKDPSFGGSSAPTIPALVAAGYAVAVQDCRGTFRSAGVFVPHAEDRADGAAAVEWLVKQPWCDGNVGSYGASYLGMVQWQTASTGALQAMVPSVTSGDLYRAPWYSPGGALSLDCALSWATMMAANKVDHEDGAKADLVALGGVMADPVPAFAHTPVADQPLVTKYLPWLADVIAHPVRDEYWQNLAALDQASDITAPALNIGGWYDLFLGETLRSYQVMREHGGSPEAREGQRLIIGPWAHSPGGDLGKFPDRGFGLLSGMAAAKITEAHVAFFDRWLRGDEHALDSFAPVRIFVMGIDTWRDEQSWPLPGTMYTDFHLDGDVLTVEEPTEDATRTYDYDPRRPVPTRGGPILAMTTDAWAGPVDQREVEARDDVLCFSTPPLTEAIEVTGPVRLTLHVSTSARDTDFTGKLVDVHPDGRAIILCEGIQRLRYRNSLEHEELATPGEVYELDIDLCATANVFRPGHRIRVEVSSSNFPRYDRNCNTGGVIAQTAEADMVVAANTVHSGPSTPSRLVLPVIGPR